MFKKFILKRLLSSLIMIIGITSISVAQQLDVSGTIVDASDGSPLIGVTVIQKGTTNGSISDVDGKYSISVQRGDTLVFSYVGYEGQELVALANTLNVSLSESSEMLEEVLIIGYGTQKKTDKTGAVAKVEASDLNSGNLSDPIQGLQGKAAGVSITKKGGDPNAGFTVRVRGSSGYAASSDPLYVIDGIPGADPTMISAEDIESYNILKDAASTAIYGSRGANGVIIITTKKGSESDKKGLAVGKVTFDTKYSLSKVDRLVDVLNAQQIRDYAVQYNKEFIDGGANTNWQDEIYRTGSTFEKSLSFSGSSDKSFYRASITHNDWVGVMQGTSKERTTAKINLTHKGINDRLTLSANMAVAFENNDYENYSGNNKDDIVYQALTRNPTDPVYDADGNFDKTQRVFNYENPLAVIDMVTNVRDAKRYLGSLKADLLIAEGLNFTNTVSYIRNDQEFTYFRPKGVFASADNGFGRRSYDNYQDKQFESYLTYVKTFNAVHNINLMGGYSWREASYDGLYSQAQNPQSPYIGANDLRTFSEVVYGDVGSYKSSETLIGFFARGQYNFNNKYYFTASIRRDGSSKFGINNKWGWFPTASAGWNINKDFMQDVSWLDQLKLRASYGISGNQAFGAGYSQVSYRPTGLATNPETGQQVVTFEPARNNNPDLKWERTAETNIGIDFAVLNSKLSGTVEVYQKHTTDMLYPKPVAIEGGNVSNRTFDNAGELLNKGVELYLQAYVVNKSNITYNTSLTVARNKSKWINLFNPDESNEDGGYENNGYLSGRGAVGDAFYIIRNQEGHEVSEFYLPEIVDIIDGEFIFKSKTGGYTNQLANAQRVFAGSPNPEIELGWSNNFTFYKNWTLDFSLRSMIGHKKYNATKMFMDSPFDLPDLNAVEDALSWAEQGRVTTAVIATEYLEDASFVKLDYLAIGYNFDTKKISWLHGLRLSVVANNLFTITKYTGADPEIYYSNLAYGWDQYNVYPNTRSFTFGLNATF
ncbi:MAG: hypothetical protein C0598_01680 [Marinilabiliales bacterium]|nr:MAG: hypothetical protein C0598_01680 [Marinilabiliales bacterium]